MSRGGEELTLRSLFEDLSESRSVLFHFFCKVTIILRACRNLQAVFDNTNICPLVHITVKCCPFVHKEGYISLSFRLWVQIVPAPCIKSEHVGENLEVVFPRYIAFWFVLRVGNQSVFIILSNEIRVDQPFISIKQSLTVASFFGWWKNSSINEDKYSSHNHAPSNSIPYIFRSPDPI